MNLLTQKTPGPGGLMGDRGIRVCNRTNHPSGRKSNLIGSLQAYLGKKNSITNLGET